jgi:hypothetical protein
VLDHHYLVTFDTDGGTPEPMPNPVTVFAASFEAGARAFPADPVRDTPFVKWTLDEPGAGAAFESDSTLPGSSGDGTAAPVTLYAQYASTDATLAALEVDPGDLSPPFGPLVTEYGVTVGNSVTSVTVTATTAHPGATAVVAGNTGLVVGDNTVTVAVTAEDGVTVLVYTITVTRLLSSDATLAGLEVTPGALSPPFDPDETAYEVTVPYAVTSIAVTPTAADPDATVEVVGDLDDLNVGFNTIIVTVTAEDGTTTMEYTLTVWRLFPEIELPPPSDPTRAPTASPSPAPSPSPTLAPSGGILFGNRPPAGGGFGTFAFGGGTLEQLLSASGCPPATAVFFYNKPDGGWAVWVPGSQVALVNAEFRAIFSGSPPIPAGTIFTAKCV